MRLRFLFSAQEIEAWEKLLEKLATFPWWDDFVSAVEKKRIPSKEKQRQIADGLTHLFSEFIVIPLGSRIIHPNFLNDIVVKFVLDVTGKTIDEFHEIGSKVSASLLSNETYLLIPKELFNEDNTIADVALWAVSTSLAINRNYNRNLAVIGKFVNPLMNAVSGNDELAEILYRHGVIDLAEDDTRIVHFDRLLIALGDPTFLDEITPHLTESLPAEVFIGKNSVFAHALSASIVNSLLFASITAQQKGKEKTFLKELKKIRERLEELDANLTASDPDWDRITEIADDIFIHIKPFVQETLSIGRVMSQIMEKSRAIGVFPDIAMEALLGLVRHKVTSKEWEWLLATQELALAIASEGEPLYRQPLYWLVLTLARIATIPEELEKKVKESMQHLLNIPVKE